MVTRFFGHLPLDLILPQGTKKMSRPWCFLIQRFACPCGSIHKGHLCCRRGTRNCGFFPTLRIWKTRRSKIATLIQLDIGIIVISLISWFCCWPCVPLQNELKQKYTMKTFKHELQYLHCLRKEGSLCIPFLTSWNTTFSTCILLDII